MLLSKPLSLSLMLDADSDDAPATPADSDDTSSNPPTRRDQKLIFAVDPRRKYYSMEEASEKRRARLQAMRAEASTQSEPLPSSSSSSSVQGLSNPLMNSAAGEMTPQATRFDFYTDPMAAFSGSKRRNPSAGGGGGGSYCYLESFSSPIRSPSPLSYPSNRPNAGPRNYHVAATHPSPSLQFPANQSPNQSPWGSLIPLQSPFTGNIGGTPPNYTPNPNSWNRSGGGSPVHGFPPNYSSRGGGFRSPSFRHGGSPSPHSNSGRGSGWQFTDRGSSSSPRSGRSGGRGRRSYYDRGFARHEPQHYYIKTFVKDPWRKLKPVVGNILVPRSGFGSWLPKSIATPKRAKVVESSTKPQLSLAESLALSLEEAANEV